MSSAEKEIFFECLCLSGLLLSFFHFFPFVVCQQTAYHFIVHNRHQDFDLIYYDYFCYIMKITYNYYTKVYNGSLAEKQLKGLCLVCDFQAACHHLAMKKVFHHGHFQFQHHHNLMVVTHQRKVPCMVLHHGVVEELHSLLNTYSLILGKWLQLVA